MSVQFTVFGHAMPGGSKKAFVHPAHGRAVIVDASNNKSWRQEVAHAAQAAMEHSDLTEPLRCALSVSFVFYRPRPKGHYGTGKNAGVVKESAPAFPTTRPDVLKLARAVEDSMTGIVYGDDSQIVDERLVKRWGSPERVEIVVRPIDLPALGTLELAVLQAGDDSPHEDPRSWQADAASQGADRRHVDHRDGLVPSVLGV